LKRGAMLLEEEEDAGDATGGGIRKRVAGIDEVPVDVEGSECGVEEGPCVAEVEGHDWDGGMGGSRDCADVDVGQGVRWTPADDDYGGFQGMGGGVEVVGDEAAWVNQTITTYLRCGGREREGEKKK